MITTEVKTFRADWLKFAHKVPDKYVNLILCDLPYGTTACKWDTIIPFDFLWSHYKRIIKPNGAIVLTATNPFAALLITSNIKQFKYEIVWDKVNRYTGSVNANHMPLRRHENVLVFGNGKITYNKQYVYKKRIAGGHKSDHGRFLGKSPSKRESVTESKLEPHNPCSILPIKSMCPDIKGHHPTQKPVALMEYLIKTYSNEGDLVLDNCMGSGTTGVACINTNRRFVGVEKDETYFSVAEKRIQEALCARNKGSGEAWPSSQ